MRIFHEPLKFTGAEQRTAADRKRASRIGWWIWGPLYLFGTALCVFQAFVVRDPYSTFAATVLVCGPFGWLIFGTNK